MGDLKGDIKDVNEDQTEFFITEKPFDLKIFSIVVGIAIAVFGFVFYLYANKEDKAKDLPASLAAQKEEILKEDKIVREKIQSMTAMTAENKVNVTVNSQPLDLMESLKINADRNVKPDDGNVSEVYDSLFKESKSDNIIAPPKQSFQGDDKDETMFSYSKRNKKADNYDGPEAKEVNTANNPVGMINQEINNIAKNIGNTRQEVIQNIITYNQYQPVAIFEGTFIDGVLLNKLVCDTEESPVLVAISKDLFDNTGRFVMLPADTRIIGYSQVVKGNGATRLFIIFKRFILPNGVSINIPQNSKYSAHTNDGSLGVASKINSHFWKKMKSSVFFGMLDGLGGLAQNRLNQNSGYSMMIDRTSGNFSQINQEMFRQHSNIMPTITVDSGSSLKIFVSDDILISPYCLVGERSYAK